MLIVFALRKSAIFSECEQRAIQSETEFEGQPPGVAVLGQVRQGLESLLEGGHRFAEGGAVVSPGAGLLAVGDGLVPHLAPHGMVRQAVDLLGHSLGRKRPRGPRPGARAALAAALAGGCCSRPRASGHV